MRLKLYEDAIRAKTKSAKKGDKTVDPDDTDSKAGAASPTRTAAAAPVPGGRRISIYLSIYLFMSMCVSMYPSIYLFIFYLSVYLSRSDLCISLSLCL